MSDGITEVQLPKLGESIVQATVIQWLKKEGDSVARDEPLLEVSTDKLNSEIPAPASGVLQKILVMQGEEADVGAPLALIRTSAETPSSPPKGEEPKMARPTISSSRETFLSPAVLQMAQENGISSEVLASLQGSGEEGRLTKKDLRLYLEGLPTERPPSTPQEGVEKVPMCHLRKAIAANLVKSFYEAPHASLVAEADVTELMAHIEKNKEDFLRKHGVKLTITSYLIRALAEAVARYPMVNASLENEHILLKKFVNVGIAVSVENGILVPVIHHCEQKDLPRIAREVAALAGKARTGKLTTEDTKEGTITMTNFGMSGMLSGTPIIRFPEVAIIGLGSIHKQVAVLDNDTFGIRRKVYITLTFDHRVIDGIYGADFLNCVRTFLEKI